jgi:hypothetical protein
MVNGLSKSVFTPSVSSRNFITSSTVLAP